MGWHRMCAALALPFTLLALAPGLFVLKDILAVRLAPGRYDLVATGILIGIIAVLARHAFNWIPAKCPKCGGGQAFVMPDTKMARYRCNDCGEEVELELRGGD